MSTDSALRVPHIEILVRRAQAGDRGAFEELVRRYERQIIARFIGSVPSSDTAEDLAQETFVRAWVHLKSLRDPSSFGPWLFGIAGNVHKEWAKDRKKRGALPEPDRPKNPELERRKVAFHQQVFNIVQDLPQPYGEILSLRYFSGISCQEIAELLGRPVGTVTKQISRAHALVAMHLKGLQGYTTLLHFMLPSPLPTGLLKKKKGKE